MIKIGADDFLLHHSLEEFLSLNEIDIEDPAFEGFDDWYGSWKNSRQTDIENVAAASTIARISAHPRDDIGNGNRFVDQHGIDTKWSNEIGWRFFNGKFWDDNRTREIERRAESTARTILIEAYQTRDKDESEKLTTWAHQSASMSKINAMLESAKNKPGMSVSTSMFDSNPWLLNLKNGTSNLETGDLQPHNQKDFITKYIDIDYDPTATCPLWIQFLERIIPSEATRQYVQRAVGYSLSGSTREHCFFILYGTGANGKSTFLDVLREMLAGYGGVMRAESLMVQNNQGGGASPDIAALRGLRFVSSSETDEGKRLAEGLMKEMSGNRTIKARFLYKDEFEFQPTFKIWLAVNHLPRIRGTDEGIWRRLKRIPFNVSIPTNEQDKKLVDKLILELPGILTWALEGYKIWAKDGIGDCEEVTSATKEYRDQSDSLKTFIEECCVLGHDRFVEKADLYQKYQEWAKNSGEYGVSKTVFGTRIMERGIEGRKSGKWFWDGIGLAGGEHEQEDWLSQ